MRIDWLLVALAIIWLSAATVLIGLEREKWPELARRQRIFAILRVSVFVTQGTLYAWLAVG